jgi:hypothetical protein
MDDLVGLAVFGRKAGPAAELLGRVEPADVADLGHEDGPEDLAHPRQAHQSLIARIGLQAVMELGVDLGDLAFDVCEQVTERSEAQRVGLGQLEGVELGLADRPPELGHDGEDPVLGHHSVDLGLGTGAMTRQRVAIAHELAQLSDLGWRDPAF